MADKTIDQLTELTTLDANDLLIAYDVSELGTEKIRKITKTNAFAGIDVGDVTTAQLVTTSGVLNDKINTTTPNLQNLPSRQLNTVYRNTSKSAIYVAVATNGPTINTTSAWSDSANPPTTCVGSVSGGVSWSRFIFFIVLPNNYYKITYDGTAPFIASWAEWSCSFDSSGGGNTAPIIDWANPINITTTPTTLTIGKHHVITETTADRTHTLPAVSGNAGRQISIQIAASTTKLITIDGNASETIDGSLTRIMWAGEAATLLCNGTTWSKIAGKSRPMYTIGSVANYSQTSVGYTYVKAQIAHGTSNYNMMATDGNYSIDIPRAGLWDMLATVSIGNASSQSAGARIYHNSNYVDPPTGAVGGYPTSQNTYIGVPAVVGDRFTIHSTSSLANPTNVTANLRVVEVAPW